MTTPTTALRPKTNREYLENPKLREAVAESLPRHVSPDRWLRVALTALLRPPKPGKASLTECTPASFVGAMLSLSQLGLEPDERRAHLVPFRNTRAGTVECKLIVGYMGFVELAMRSGEVASIHADVVCEHDAFEEDTGRVRHKINRRKSRGKVYAAYAVCRFKGGGENAEVMSLEDIEAIRKRSKSANDGPWVTDWNEMAKKTVFRRLAKWLPLSPELRESIETEDGEPLPMSPKLEELTGDLAEMINADAVHATEPSQVTSDSEAAGEESQEPAPPFDDEPGSNG